MNVNDDNTSNTASMIMTASNALLIRSFADMIDQTQILPSMNQSSTLMMQRSLSSASTSASTLQALSRQRYMNTNMNAATRRNYMNNMNSNTGNSMLFNANGSASQIQSPMSMTQQLGVGISKEIAAREELSNAMTEHADLFSLLESRYDDNLALNALAKTPTPSPSPSHAQAQQHNYNMSSNPNYHAPSNLPRTPQVTDNHSVFHDHHQHSTTRG
jgi:hypothetical protein